LPSGSSRDSFDSPSRQTGGPARRTSSPAGKMCLHETRPQRPGARLATTRP
jgi:hypothetical protein